MEGKSHIPVFSTPAFLWDGVIQLSGILEVWEREVVFSLNNFKESHLSLSIPLTAIERVEEYLVFDLAKNGLRIQDKDGKYDLFVLEEVHQFKNRLLAAMERL